MSIMSKATAMTSQGGIEMPTKPQLFNLTAIALFAIAFSFPLQIAQLYGYSITDPAHIFAIWNKLSINNIATILILTISAWKVWNVEKDITMWLVSSCIIVTMNNIIVSAYASDWSSFDTTLSSFCFIFALSTVMFSTTYEHAFEPELQWWRPARRHRIEAPIVIEFLDRHRFQAQMFDLSTSGLFITDVNQPIVSSMAPVNEEMAIKIPFKNQLHAFTAKLVRKTHKNGKYPGGWGLSFTHLNPWQRVKLAWMIHNPQTAFTF